MEQITKTPHKQTALVVDLQTKEMLGKLSLINGSVPVSDWIDSKGPLQLFAVIEGMDELREVWHYQEEALLITKTGQRKIKIITYPTEGETQGYLDYTTELKPHNSPQNSSNPILKRGLAYIQSLLGT